MPCSSTKGRKKKQGLKYDQILPKNLHLKSLLLRNLPVSVFPSGFNRGNHTGVCQGVPQGCIQPEPVTTVFSLPTKKKPRNTLNNQVFVDAWKSIGRKKPNLYMENGLWNHHFHPLQTGCFEVPGKHERQFASRSGDSTRFTWKKNLWLPIFVGNLGISKKKRLITFGQEAFAWL